MFDFLTCSERGEEICDRNRAELSKQELNCEHAHKTLKLLFLNLIFWEEICCGKFKKKNSLFF